ncbi:MAG TPA: MFS transporter, partial [Candidatus Hodarchaeales archaeon]|nr:MFS transporter [Candidatus Hodarchaeales archaeon]
MKNEAGRPVWAKGFWSGIDRNAKLVIFSDVVGSLGRSLVWFAGPFLILALGGGKVDLGDIFAIATFVSAAVTLLAGISSDFFKRRDLFLWAGAALQLFSYSMLVTANSLDVLLLANVMASIASALFMPTKMTIIGDTVESSKKNQVFAALFLFDNVSFGMGNIVGFFVFQDATAEISLAPLRFALIIALSFMLLEFLVVLFIRDRGKKDLADEYRQKPQINASTKLFDRRTAILVVAANYTVSLGAGTSIIFMSVFFNEYYGISLSLISLIFGVMIFFTAYW